MLNTTKKRIALVGSAPSSINLVPYNHPEWFVFACSPGAYGIAGPHADAWAELHRWEPQVAGHAGTGQPWFSPEYVEFLTRFKGTVYMADPLPPEIPNATLFPMQEMVEKYGPFFFTSSLSFMWALALETPGVEEIGLFGVDMAATEEYGYQRAGCQYFITLAVQRGIKVTIPPESDILQPSFWYGITENSPMAIKLTQRRRELEGRLSHAQHREAQAREEAMFLRGALDDLNYMWNTWVTYQSWIEPKMMPTGNEVRSAAVAPVDGTSC